MSKYTEVTTHTARLYMEMTFDKDELSQTTKMSRLSPNENTDWCGFMCKLIASGGFGVFPVFSKEA